MSISRGSPEGAEIAILKIEPVDSPLLDNLTGPDQSPGSRQAFKQLWKDARLIPEEEIDIFEVITIIDERA